MQALGLHIVELLDIVRVCGSLQVNKCPASYLSDYLAVHLAWSDQDLARKVRQLDEEQMEELAQRIHQLQMALRHHSAAPVDFHPANM